MGLLVWSQLMGNLKDHGDLYVFGLGILLVIGPSIVLPQMLRCPRCSHRLGRLASRMAFSLFGLARMKNCPYCGVDLDEPMSSNQISQR